MLAMMNKLPDSSRSRFLHGSFQLFGVRSQGSRWLNRVVGVCAVS